MSDSWEYRFLWEYAGLQPPDFHEDELERISRVLWDVADGILHGAGKVTHELSGLQNSGISSAAFDALNVRWHGRGLNAIQAVADTLEKLARGLDMAQREILQWKANLVIAVGLVDAGLTIEYVGTFGAGAVVNRLGRRVAGAEIRHKLEGLVDELEGKLLTLVIEDTPLKDIQDRVEKELQKLLEEAIDTVGTSAGTYAGSL